LNLENSPNSQIRLKPGSRDWLDEDGQKSHPKDDVLPKGSSESGGKESCYDLRDSNDRKPDIKDIIEKISRQLAMDRTPNPETSGSESSAESTKKSSH